MCDSRPYLYIYPNHKKRTYSMLFSYFRMIFMKKDSVLTSYTRCASCGSLVFNTFLLYGLVYREKLLSAMLNFIKIQCFPVGAFSFFMRKASKVFLLQKTAKKRAFLPKKRE